jgi:hypothetical protein
MDKIMRKIFFRGTAGLLLVFAAIDANAMGGGNISPEASPYALISPRFDPAPSVEGRSADTGGAGDFVARDRRGRVKHISSNARAWPNK